MAVVTKSAQGMVNPNGASLLPEAIYRGNPIRAVQGSFAVTNGDSIASKLIMAKVPSSVIFLPFGLVTHTAITGLTDFDIGFLEDTDALADGLNLSSAGTKSPLAVVTTANLIQPAWKLAGYTKDPAIELTMLATLNAAAAADGTIHFFVPYIGKL